jgi:predicted oxidoreductase
MNPMQIELLKKYVKQPIVANQLQLSVTNSSMISSGLEVNMLTNGAVNRDGNVLDYCRLNDITIQTWSPFQYGFFEGTFLGSDKFPKLNEVINDIAAKYCVANTSVAAAWIMRHPANMQLIAGTMNPNRLDEIIDGSKITLTREEWYKIYLAAGNILP